jgi:hypothetical protein
MLVLMLGVIINGPLRRCMYDGLKVHPFGIFVSSAVIIQGSSWCLSVSILQRSFG